jgi:MoaA/NifB/PqqE/SkfB family radical SAM enzyme
MLRRNSKLVRRALVATGRDEAPLPEIVQIESTNICNATCVFCPRDEMARKQGVMDMDLFKKVVDECVELGIEHVRMHNYGEPFVDRALVEKVRYAKRKGVPQVGMISNGSLITEEAARGMIEAGLDAINISVDASGKEVFEKTRVGLKYDKVIANIERLLALREQAGTRRPKLILSFVRQDNSEDEHAFIEHWRKRADKIHITDLHNWAGTLNQRSDVNYPCYRPWLTFTILWDGRVSLCCADFDGRNPSKKKRSVGSPQTVSAARTDEAPGTVCTTCPASWAARTSL